MNIAIAKVISIWLDIKVVKYKNISQEKIDPYCS